MMVAGANAGIKQNGKAPKASTPIEPVSIESFVRIKAVAEVAIMSKNPKIFQNQVSFFAKGLPLLMDLATKILPIAVIKSPQPAKMAMEEGSTL